MIRSSLILVFLLALIALAGCSSKTPTAKKEIQVPNGGAPVLTTAERNAAERNTAEVAARAAQLRQPGVLAQASYQQPADSQGQTLKPFEQWTDQEAAEVALGRIGAPAVPALIDMLQNPDPAVRKKAIEVLGRMGEDAAPAVPALTALLNDPDLAVRKAAARTLGQIGPEAQAAVPALMRTLFNPPQLQPTQGVTPPLQAVPAQSQPE
jgi:hypothetical protein